MKISLKKLIFFIPLVILVIFVMMLTLRLAGEKLTQNSTSFVQSPLVGKRVPEFTLPALYKGEKGLDSNDFPADDNEMVLINIFASWCVTCRGEHPYLMQLAQKGIKIYGINWKDKPQDTKNFLAQLGNPYQEIGIDESGTVGVDFGITGAPETFLISNGTILYRHSAPITPKFIEKMFEDY